MEVQGAKPSVGCQGSEEAEKLFPFAHPAEAANLSYFLFICSILHVQAQWRSHLALLARPASVVCLSGTDVHCDHMMQLKSDLSSTTWSQCHIIDRIENHVGNLPILFSMQVYAVECMHLTWCDRSTRRRTCMQYSPPPRVGVHVPPVPLFRHPWGLHFLLVNWALTTR